MPSFQVKRDTEVRQRKLLQDLDNSTNWILSGSLCGWGDMFIPKFDLVVYLWIPKELRMTRLLQREVQRYGAGTIKEGGTMHEASLS